MADILGRQHNRGSSPSKSRPSSIHGEIPLQNGDPPRRLPMASISTQTEPADDTEPPREIVTAPPVQVPAREYITYSKAVQTDPVADVGVGTNGDFEDEEHTRPRRRSSRKQKEQDEEIRASLRREIEEEIRATQGDPSIPVSSQQRFPLRQLNSNELNAVTSSPDFQSFIESTSRYIDRWLDEEYDILRDYSRAAIVDTEEDYASKTSQSLREVLQLYSATHSRRRMVTDLNFSPHDPELLLTSYTKNSSAPNEPNGLVLLWNTHAPSRPEYVFNASSDVLTARFSPFHRNLIVGGCYSGQVCIWDTRSSHRNGQPERRTPPSGPGSHLGHTHPIFSLSIIGTQNAHNILTADTDGIVCSWSADMLTQAQEYLYLSIPASSGSKTDDLAPKSMSFPTADPTFFLVGSEEGTIYPCHRYDRAGAKAGVDSRLAYKGHTAPIMSTQYHPGRGPVDLGDLMLSSSSDWTVKLWKTRAAAPSGTVVKPTQTSTTTSAATGMNDSTSTAEVVDPMLNIALEDLVYDAKWSPNKPSVFAAVTGAGDVEVFDLLSDVEVPVARATPSKTKLPNSATILPLKGLNKLAWEERNGRQLAVGGLDGVVSLFEVGRGLWCNQGDADVREWHRMKALVTRLENEAN